MKNLRVTMYMLIVAAILFAQFLSPGLARADDETTPVPSEVTSTEAPATEAPSSPTEAPTETEAPDPSSAATTDVVPATSAETPALTETFDSSVTAATETAISTNVEEGVSTEAPVPSETIVVTVEPVTPTPEPPPAETETSTPEASAADEPSLLENLQSVPTDTNVVVLDENGQALSLASQDAATVIAEGDPVWCPNSQTTPTPGQNGCSTSYSNLLSLVSSGFIPSGNGTIWITGNSDSSTSTIIIDGNGNWSGASTYSLTLQGDMTGNSGDPTYTGTTVFTVPLNILNWNNTVTINNITIDGANNPSGSGLVVTGTGNVNINQSNFINSGPGSGSQFDYGDGVDIVTNGNVSITNSRISGNSWDGLWGRANSYTVTNSSITSNGQNGYGSGINVAMLNRFEFYDATLNNPQVDVLIYCINTNSSVYLDFPAAGVLSNYGINSICQAYNATNPPANITSTPTPSQTATTSPAQTATPTPSQTGMTNTPSNTATPSAANTPTNAATPSPTNLLPTLQMGTPIPRPGTTPKPGINTPAVRPNYVPKSASQQNFYLQCSNNTQGYTKTQSYGVPLPNGDKVEIVCPVSGRAFIARLDNTILPGELPAGYAYASAFQLDISSLQVVGGDYGRKSVDVITEGGYFKISFVAANSQAGKSYAILFWDNQSQQWIVLKDFAYGKSFPLFPANPNDKRVIRSGVQLVGNRVEAETNFPGIFVLAQY